MCSPDPQWQSRRLRLPQLAIPTTKILAIKLVDPTRPDRRLQHLQLLVIITLCPVSQIVIWRVFIAQIKINQAGECAVEYRRRPLIGEPGLHFCPFRTAPLGDRRVVIGVDVELNDRRTVAERDSFFSCPPPRDPGTVFGPLFPLEARCVARLTRHPTFPPRQVARRPYCPIHAGCGRMPQPLARSDPS